MKKTISAIITLIFVSSVTVPAWAVPVGNDVEFIPVPRNLGIGKIDPKAKLVVNGDVLIQNGSVSSTALTVNGKVLIRGGTPGIGQVLTSDALGLATWEPISASQIPNLDASKITTGIIASSFIDPNFRPSALKAADGDPDPALFVNNSGNIGIANTSPNELLSIGGRFSLMETIAPSASSGYGKIYVKSSDSKLYFKDDAGNEFDLSATTGSRDPWVLVHVENFETTPTGWNNNTTTSCAGHKILGGFNVLGVGSSVFKSFDLSAYPHDAVKVKFNYYSLDSWGDARENAFAKIDGIVAWVQQGIYFSDAERVIFSNCGSGGLATNATYGKDEILTGEALLDHSSNTLRVDFSSTLNQAPNDESFGIDNLEIWVRTPVVASVPPPPPPSNNAGCSADGFYHVTAAEDSSGSGSNDSFGSGPSTVDFTQCDKVLYLEGGHSVTRTWTFTNNTNPPRSGNVTFYVQKRRAASDSTGTGFGYYFRPNISIPDITQIFQVANRNADITFNCFYNATSQTYSCTTTKVIL